MDLNDRQKEILQELQENRQVRVNKLARTLFASEMTIRRDLEYLENEGFLVRCHGGAIPLGNPLRNPIKYRMWINSKEKKELAARAGQYIKDDQVIFFNSSSTCAYLLPYLKKYQNLHVITNSIHLLTLLGSMHIPCTVTGGEYHEVEQCLYGSVTEAFLADVNPDIAFLSCEGVTEDGEITESQPDMARIAKLALKNAKQTVFLLDASKKQKKYTYTVCRAQDTENVILL